MHEPSKVQEQQSLARRIAQTMPPEEQQRFRTWVARLVEIRQSNVGSFSKAVQAVTATVSNGVAISIARQLAGELKRLGWTERGLKWRVAFLASVVSAVMTGGQGAGIAALGGAIGVPLWLVIGAGGAFLAMLYEELGAGSSLSSRLVPDASNASAPEVRAGNLTPAFTSFIIDVDAKEIVSSSSGLIPAPELWVGDLDSVLFVHDPVIQLKEGPHVFLWNSRTGEMNKYVPATVRPLIRRSIDPASTERACRSYADWLKREGEIWLSIEVPYYKSRLAKELLNNSKIETPTRVTHCYRCKEPLAGNVDAPCSICSWMVCSNCQACRCGYAV